MPLGCFPTLILEPGEPHAASGFAFLIRRFYKVSYSSQTWLPPPAIVFATALRLSHFPLAGERMDDIVPNSEQHQEDDEGETDPEQHLLRRAPEGPPANRLQCVEDQMAAVEKGYREEVQEADGNREDGREKDQAGDPARLGDLLRDLRDLDGSAELLRVSLSDHQPRKE